jgi:hypothetical protein
MRSSQSDRSVLNDIRQTYPLIIAGESCTFSSRTWGTAESGASGARGLGGHEIANFRGLGFGCVVVGSACSHEFQ